MFTTTFTLVKLGRVTSLLIKLLNIIVLICAPLYFKTLSWKPLYTYVLLINNILQLKVDEKTEHNVRLEAELDSRDRRIASLESFIADLQKKLEWVIFLHLYL